MKNRVLISCVGNKVSLVKAFQNSGWYVVGSDKDDDVAGKYICDEFRNCDFTDIIINDVDLVVPTYDGELLYWAEARHTFDWTIAVANPGTIFTCINKRAFHSFVGNEYFGYRDALKIIEDRPLFLQSGSNTGGSKTSHLITAKDDLNYLYNCYGRNIIVFDYYDWDEYTIDLFSDFNGNVLSIVPREREVVRNGESWVARIDMNSILINAATKLSQDLGQIGHNTLQCFFDGTTVRWIEVNARYGGGFPLAYAAGMDTPGMLLDIINDKEPRKVTIQDGLKMYRYTENLFV